MTCPHTGNLGTKSVRTNRKRIIAAATAVVSFSATSAMALDWDITPGTVGAGDSAVTGGTGTWSTLATLGNWTADAGASNVAWVNQVSPVLPDDAVFGDVAGTVTLGSAITAGDLKFNTAGYIVDPATFALTISTTSGANGATVQFGSAGGTLNLRNDAATTYALDIVANQNGTVNVNRVGATASNQAFAIGTATVAAGVNFNVTGGNGFYVNGGTLAFGGATATVTTGSSNTVVDNYNVTSTSGAAALTKAGGGRLKVTGANGNTGTISVTGGEMLLLGTNSSGNVTSAGGIFALGPSANLGSAVVTGNFGMNPTSSLGTGSVSVGSGQNFWTRADGTAANSSGSIAALETVAGVTLDANARIGIGSGTAARTHAVSSAADFDSTRLVLLGYNGVLQLTTGSGAVTTTQRIGAASSTFASGLDSVGTIDIPGANDSLTFQFQLGNSTNGNSTRDNIRKTGAGKLEFLPTSVSLGSVITRRTIDIAEGTVRVNQMPYRNSGSGDTGFLIFSGNSTFSVAATPGFTAAQLATQSNYNGGYGFQDFLVAPGVTGTIKVDSDAVFKTDGRVNNNTNALPADSTLVLDGTDDTSRFDFGPWSSSGGNNGGLNGTVELRGGTLRQAAYNQNNAQVFGFNAGSTIKLNGGVLDLNNFAQGSNPANLIVNSAPGSTTPRITIATTGLNNVGAAGFGSAGDTSWAGTLEKLGTGRLEFNRTGGTVTAATDAKLLVSAGEVRVGGTADPFNGLAIENASTFSVSTGAQALVGNLTGAGTTNVSGNLTLKQQVTPLAANTQGGLSITGGKVDLTNNKLTITTASDATIRSQIAAGRNGGAWDGATGITSSTAAIDPLTYGVGHAATGGGSKVSYSLLGDLDLDGDVDFDDAFELTNNYGTPSGSVWVNGDTDYDGDIDFDDAFSQVNNYGGALATTSGGNSDGVASLVYDASTGTLKIEHDFASGLKSFNISIGSGAPFSFNASEEARWETENKSFSVDLATQQGFSTNTALGATFLAANGYVIDDALGGTLLASGLSQASLLQYLTITYGIEGQTGTKTGDLIVIPEPTTLGLLGLAAMGLGRRRRTA